jgi:hypothetical protein
MGLLSVIQALCSGWLESGDRPSMVVTCLPRMVDICTLHERVGSPSRCTVQAPHCATPHPNFVPVSLKCSRRGGRGEGGDPNAPSIWGSSRHRALWVTHLTTFATPLDLLAQLGD